LWEAQQTHTPPPTQQQQQQHKATTKDERKQHSILARSGNVRRVQKTFRTPATPPTATLVGMPTTTHLA